MSPAASNLAWSIQLSRVIRPAKAPSFVSMSATSAAVQLATCAKLVIPRPLSRLLTLGPKPLISSRFSGIDGAGAGFAAFALGAACGFAFSALALGAFSAFAVSTFSALAFGAFGAFGAFTFSGTGLAAAFGVAVLGVAAFFVAAVFAGALGFFDTCAVALATGAAGGAETAAGGDIMSLGALSVFFFAPPSGSSNQNKIATTTTAPMMTITELDNVFLPRKPKKQDVQLRQNMAARNYEFAV